MYCSKCGEKVLEGASFCAKCGMKLDIISQQDVSGKLQTAKKVSNCNCSKCGYSGNMKFIRYKWGPIKRYVLLIVVALVGDVVLVPHVNSVILFILGIGLFWLCDTIGAMPKYLQCPNCDSDIYVVNTETVVDNPTYTKPHDIGSSTQANKGISDKVWKYLSIALVVILLLCITFIRSLVSDKKENSKDYTEIKIKPTVSNIAEIEEQEEAETEIVTEVKTETKTEAIPSEEVITEENMGIDEEIVADVYTDAMYIACVNVHNTLMNYLNGNTSVQFSIDDLRMISENFSIIKKQNLYEAPLNVEEYEAMRDGPTIRFDYEDYACIFWTLDTNEVVVGFAPEE